LPEGVLAEVALGPRLPDGLPEAGPGQVQLVAHVDVGRVGAHPVAADDAPFDERVGVALHDGAVLEGPRLPFVGVDDEVARLLRVLRHEAPLRAAIEASAAAPADMGLLDLFYDALAG